MTILDRVDRSIDEQPPVPSIKDLSWLLRYADYCRIPLDPDNVIQSLRSHFSAAAWRLVCRSNRDDFLPILRNRLLDFSDLIRYTKILVRHSWVSAPNRQLLEFMILESYLYYDCKPHIPNDTDKLMFMRLAHRNGLVPKRELALVRNWQDQTDTTLKTNMKWSTLVTRAKAWDYRLQIKLRQQRNRPWYFYTHALPWRGYEIEPLRTGLDLLDEGRAMSNCLFKLRRLCEQSHASRFFSVKKDGERLATLELVFEPPAEWMTGPDFLKGRWGLQDCRFTRNRVPPETMINDLKAFAWQYNIWAKRPARQPVASNDSAYQARAKQNGQEVHE